MICHKLEKICVDASVENKVFGPDSQLSHSRTFFKQNKNSESSFKMSGFFKQFTNINSEVYKVDWLVYLNYLSSFTTARLKCCFLQVQQISSLPENPSFLFRQNCFERKFKNRTEMVGTKHRTVQCSGINSTFCRSVNTDRCLIKGLQGNVQ